MDIVNEGQAMRWLERSLDLPESEREAWLRAQDLAPGVLTRVRELLAHAARASEFMETPARADTLVGESALLVDLPQAGSRLGAWQLERELGSGGMGVIFLARRIDGAYEQRAAVKLMRPIGRGARAELQARFGNERQLLARLQHPNVVRILDGGSTDDGIPWLAMEYVEGRAINAWCDEQQLGVQERVRLLARVCAGVQAAHRHLIVHRDLKPANILVDGGGEPRVLDFGIARLLEDDAGITRTGASAMTPAYASPEQVRCEPLTTASDVYSLGVILYELVTGTRPHALDGLSPAQIERTLNHTDPRPLRKALATASLEDADKRRRIAQVGGDLERIVAHALHRDPERRYGSALAFADDLNRWLDGRPVQAHPDSAGYRIGKFLRRHRLAMAATSLALLAVLGAATAAFLQAARAQRAAADTVLVNEFLVDMLSASSPYESGSEITLAHAVDNAGLEIDKRFGDRPDLAVDIRYALGRSMLDRYRLEAAGRELARTLKESTRVFGADDRRTVRTLASIASLRKEQGRDAEATALYDDALARLRRSGQQDSALYATVLNDYGVLNLIINDFGKAERLLEEARQAGAHARDRPVTAKEHAQTLANLAHAARGLHKLDEADRLYGEADSAFRKIYPDGGPQVAIVLNNRARLARDRGEPEKALGFLQQAVAMHRRSFTGDHVMVLVPTTNLARQATELKRVDLAIEPAETAAAMADRMYASSAHYYHALALLALADVRVLQQRTADAGVLLSRAQHLLDALETPSKGSRKYLDEVRTRLCALPATAATTACRLSPATHANPPRPSPA